MVTGKNKEQFRSWYFDNDMNAGGTLMDLLSFYNLPFELQIGVYLAYYNSLGYDIYPDACSCHSPSLYTFTIKNHEYEFVYYSYDNYSDFQNPIESYKEAFKKADELINQQN